MLSFQALAIPVLTISDGTTTHVITDNDVGDEVVGSEFSHNGDGQIVWIGSIGNFSLTVTTAVTKPEQGSELLPFLDINSAISTKKSTYFKPALGDTLTITFTEDGFTGDPVSMLAALGGTMFGASSLTFDAWYTDSLGDHPLTSINATDMTAFGSTESAMLDPNETPYSITIRTVIKQGAGKYTSFDAQFAVPDGGATATLLGLGVLSFAALRRKLGLEQK